MGNQNSGNHNPRRRADPDDRSRSVVIRLNPRKESHRWALDFLQAFEEDQARLPETKRRYRGDLIVEALMALAGREQVEPTVTASAQDVAAIRDMVQYVMDRMDSDEFVGRGNGKRRRPEAKANISEAMQATIDHYIANGYTGSDDLDEDA